MDNKKNTIIFDVDTNLKTGVSVINLLFPKNQPLTVKESTSILTVLFDVNPSPLMKVKK